MNIIINKRYLQLTIIGIIAIGNTCITARPFANASEAIQTIDQAINSVIQPTSMYHSEFLAPSINNMEWQAFAQNMQEYVEKNATLPILGKDKNIMAYYKNILDYAQLLFGTAEKAHDIIFSTTGTAPKKSVHTATINYFKTIEQKLIILEKNSKINALYASSTTVNAKKEVVTVLKAFIQKLEDVARMAREEYEHMVS